MQTDDNVIDLKRTIENDQRKEPRMRALKRATLSFNQGYGVFEGVVRNQSPSGAKLSFGEALGVPNRFLLTVSGDARARLAEIRWRGDGEVGVAFVEEAGRQGPDPAFDR